MLKTISATLLAVSVLAAPALAAGSAKSEAPLTQAPQAKAKVNTNAKMDRHHHYSRHVHHKMGALKNHTLKTHSKVSAKHTAHAPTRG